MDRVVGEGLATAFNATSAVADLHGAITPPTFQPGSKN